MLLGLSHAEEMDSILQADMEQQDREDYITKDMDGLPINEFRFKSATELASSELGRVICHPHLLILSFPCLCPATMLVMYTASAISAIYALSSFCLLFGVTRSRSDPWLLLPWLIVDMVGVLLTMDLMLLFSHGCTIVDFIGGITNYWVLCGAVLAFDIFTWFIVHAYYLTLCRMKKLNECAVIPIPCPSQPYYYQRPPQYNEKDAMLMGLSSPA